MATFAKLEKFGELQLTRLKSYAGERGCKLNLEPNPHAVGCNAPQECKIIDIDWKLWVMFGLNCRRSLKCRCSCADIFGATQAEMLATVEACFTGKSRAVRLSEAYRVNVSEMWMTQTK